MCSFKAKKSLSLTFANKGAIKDEVGTWVSTLS